MERYSGLVYSLILDVVRRPEDVEDLVQEAFCKAYLKLANLRQPAKFPSRLGRIAYNTAMRWLRQERVRSQAEAVAQMRFAHLPTAAPDEQFETHEKLGILWEALDQLPPEHRRMVLLYYLEDCTYREIARFLDKPLATVQWRLRQSERRLGHKLRYMQEREAKQGGKRYWPACRWCRGWHPKPAPFLGGI